ncbi:MAG: DUF3750 domain-containing protein [Limnothrix sp.]
MSNIETPLEVQLRAAKIPLIGWLAVHYWFVIIEPDQITRWEIWQTRNTGGESWGHLHKNLMPFDQGVGNGASWLVTTWTGEAAKNLADLLHNSPDIYPHNYCYRYVPGPNSNTYVRWMLRRANVVQPLGCKAIGQNYVYFSR